MATITLRSLDDHVYERLKRLAAANGHSVEFEARQILEEGLRRRERWLGAKLSDLSGDSKLAQVEPPSARSTEPPRDVTL
ncbi:MAG: hypothetical protein QM804_15350 [Propionicimonas sp.]